MKKAMSRIVSLLLAATMIFGAVGIGISEIDFEDLALKASAVDEIPTKGVCGNGAKWSFDFGSGTLTISGKGKIGFEKSSGSYFFHLDDYEYRKYVEKVIIGNGITEIGAAAFSGFKSLRSVTIPSSVTGIGDQAFLDCISLTNITIPPSVISIGKQAFAGCDFSSFDIPASVEFIGLKALCGCKNLVNIYVETANQHYSCDEYGVLFNKDKTELIQYPVGNSRTSYDIPEEVTVVSDSAFANCKSLTDITLPEGLKAINDEAFVWCEALTQITIPSSVTYLGKASFAACDNLKDITVYDGIEYFGEDAFGSTAYYFDNFKNGALYIGNYLAQADSEEAETFGVIEIEPGTKVIANGAFYFDRELTDVTIPSSVEIIGKEAFYHCESLVSVTIPEGVKKVGAGAFQWCESLEIAHLPSTMPVIDSHLFYFCTNLTSVNLNSITKIGERAFACCENMSVIYITKNTKSIGEAAFYGCDNLKEIEFSGDVSDWCQIDFAGIGNELMKNAERIYFKGEEVFDIIIPYGVTRIGRNAFYGNDKITSVTIPETVVEIGYGALACENLKSVYFEGSITDWCNINFESEVPKDYLYISGKLIKDNLVIPEDVVSIGDYAFSNCKDITGIVFAGNTEKIGKGAFYMCYSLESVVLPKSMKYIGDIAFANTAITDIFIPAEVEYLNGFDVYALTSIEVDAANKRYSSDEFGVLFNKNKTELIEFPTSNPMTSYNIPESVYKIKSHAFRSKYLKNVYIPEGVAIIEDGAFSGCHELTEIYIPSTVSYIGNQAFGYCDNLGKVRICSDMVNIGFNVFKNTKFYNDESNWKYDALYIDEHLIEFRDSTAEEYVVLNGTKSIADGAIFDYDRRSVKTLTIPMSVTGISEDLCFINILKEINYEGSVDDWLNIAFLEKSLNPCGIRVNFDCSAYESNIKFTYTVDENLEVAINDFIGQISGTLVIPDMIDGYPVTSIGGMAFSYLDMDKVIFNCTHLETIGDGAFTGCANLTEITIPDGVTSIGASGFSYNDNLTTVNIPESVEYIGESCFEYNDNLTSVNWNTATLTEIKESTFEGCAVLEEITIPPSVTYIGECAFAFCENLVTVINDAINLMGIGDNAFSGCTVLQEITGTEVLYGYIGPGYSVPDAIAPKKVILPYGLETIGSRAFENCVSIKSVSIPATVKTIGESAFDNCTGIEEVNYMGTGLGWNSIDIHSGNSLLQPKSINFKGSLIYSPSTTTVKYGETLGLHANTDGLPEGAKIEWSAEGDAVSLKPTADGKSCGVVSQKSGEAVVKATVVDANGNAVLDANGEEISSTQKIASKAGLWERIVSFFKNLFRINRVIPQSVKMFF